mmetsp:Transcript_8856/g.33111  ORF Transcript_8856/g.33111 Transcript_8856/m.33111 type:complete len:204 (+) Transcript_8856:1325-1936(+)
MWSTRPPAPTPGCAGPGVVGETPASRSSKPIPLPEGPPGAPGAGAEPGLFPSKSASPMVGTFSPTLPCPAPFVSALDTGGGGATRTVPPVLAFRTATASAAPPPAVVTSPSSAETRFGKFGIGRITSASRVGLPPTLVITKYSTLRCCISTCSETACCLNSTPRFCLNCVSAPACMAILASAVRITRRVSTDAILNDPKSNSE